MNHKERDLLIIEKMHKYCNEINEAHSTFGNSYERFKNNSVYKNAVCLCLMQIGELSTKLSDEFKESNDNMPWKQIRGMRNVVAHEYGHIDDEIVWETIEDGIPSLDSFCCNILNLDEQDENFEPNLSM